VSGCRRLLSSKRSFYRSLRLAPRLEAVRAAAARRLRLRWAEGFATAPSHAAGSPFASEVAALRGVILRWLHAALGTPLSLPVAEGGHGANRAYELDDLIVRSLVKSQANPVGWEALSKEAARAATQSHFAAKTAALWRQLRSEAVADDDQGARSSDSNNSNSGGGSAEPPLPFLVGAHVRTFDAAFDYPVVPTTIDDAEGVATSTTVLFGDDRAYTPEDFGALAGRMLRNRRSVAPGESEPLQPAAPSLSPGSVFSAFLDVELLALWPKGQLLLAHNGCGTTVRPRIASAFAQQIARPLRELALRVCHGLRASEEQCKADLPPFAQTGAGAETLDPEAAAVVAALAESRIVTLPDLLQGLRNERTQLAADGGADRSSEAAVLDREGQAAVQAYAQALSALDSEPQKPDQGRREQVEYDYAVSQLRQRFRRALVRVDAPFVAQLQEKRCAADADASTRSVWPQRAAVLDWFLLSRSSVLLGSYWSSFSEEAAAINGTPLLTLTDSKYWVLNPTPALPQTCGCPSFVIRYQRRLADEQGETGGGSYPSLLDGSGFGIMMDDARNPSGTRLSVGTRGRALTAEERVFMVLHQPHTRAVHPSERETSSMNLRGCAHYLRPAPTNATGPDPDRDSEPDWHIRDLVERWRFQADPVPFDPVPSHTHGWTDDVWCTLE
jgi:hypothetical protein